MATTTPTGRIRTWLWWLARPVPGSRTHSSTRRVLEGERELFPLPDGPVVMTVTVAGGTVTRAAWPVYQP